MDQLGKYLYTFWCLIVITVTFILFYPFLLISVQNKKWVRFYHIFHTYWVKCFCIFARIRIRINQKCTLDPNKAYIFCCNHFSSFDNFAIHLLFKFPFSVIAIAKISEIPFYGYLLKKKHILINRKCIVSKNNAFWIALNRLRNNESIVISPEGGIRSTEPPKMFWPFEDGAFLLAIKSQVPIIPFVFHTNYKIVPEFPLKYIFNYPLIVTILAPIKTEGLAIADLASLKLEVYNKITEELKKKPYI